MSTRPIELDPTRFVVLRLLGQGSMGEVLLARDRTQGLDVAVKVLRHRKAAEIRRLKAEFRVLADVTHPNLVQLYELLQAGDEVVVTMEAIDGLDFVTDALVAGRRTDVPPDLSRFDATWRRRELTMRSLDATSWGELPADIGIPMAPLAARLARLRTTLGQLALGLQALHQHGKLHFDMKPPNALVEPGGRAVVLDFGLTRDLGHRPDLVVGGIEGTPLYVAPEMLRGDPVGFAADWYAVGVMLHGALTGRHPHAGTLTDLFLSRMERRPPPPSTWDPDIPAELDALCVGLLARDPDERLDGDAILAWAQAGPARPPATVTRDQFVGREQELTQLQRALDATRTTEAGGDGEARVVLVHGESGIGKSAVLARFLERAVQGQGALVLAGRCHHRESLPFNAMDRIVDALARVLEADQARGAPPLQIDGLDELARVFPVLEGVVPREGGDSTALDPGAVRTRAFEALRRVLATLAAARPVVLAVDDLQWGDRDSAQVLRVLLAAPDPPPLLVVGTYRTQEADASELLPVFDEADLGARVERIPVHALSTAEAGRLAERLRGDADEWTDSAIERLMAETRGNPFVLEQTLRYGRAHADQSVEEVLRSRIDALDPSDRSVLLATAVARGAPTTERVRRIAHAGPDAAGALVRLQNVRLLRMHGRHRVEVYHDRIREAVVAELDGVQQVELHLAYAADIERYDPASVQALSSAADGAEDAPLAADTLPTALGYVGHLLAVAELDPRGMPEARLGRLLLGAGRLAHGARAFATAATLLAQAEPCMADAASRRRVRVERARALSFDARFEEALALVEDAADGGEAEVDLIAVGVRLQALFAQQRMDEALDVARAALRQLGVSLPARPGPLDVPLALARVAWALRSTPPEALADLPTMEDPGALATMRLLRSSLTACFVAEPDLFPLLILQMVRTTLQHGNAPESAVAWAAFGILQVLAFGRSDRGAAYGRVALRVLDRLDARSQRAATEGVVGVFLVHGQRPLRDTLPHLERGFRAGVEVGDLEWAGTCATVRAYNLWFAGEPLPELQPVVDGLVSLLPRVGQARTRADLTRLQQLCASLRGLDTTSPPWTLRGHHFDAPAVLAAERGSDRANLGSLHGFLATLQYWFGDLDGALASTAHAVRDAKALDGTSNDPELWFFTALVELAAATRAHGASRRGCLRRARAARRRLAAWARRAPMNYQHALELVLAEEARLAGRARVATRHYDAAIQGASEQAVLHHLATACEAAARFHAPHDPARARRAWESAREAWTLWGAPTLARAMRPDPDAWEDRQLPSWP
ncbi:MAG: AAA family ATPase [Alphaproteobacteria bacterium]|nr:AAA family ATPase [Alphaproteobacteria bacterium]